tara:strand:+ start:1698 stop:3311 length:1614 start_codon:yes stop_codon:yes gene_type:complete
MGWSADFLSELEGINVSPKFIVEFLTDYHGTVGEAAFLSSAASAPRLIGNEVSVGGGRVTPGTWSYTKGSWSVLVIDDEANGEAYDLLQTVTRGNYAILRVGFLGWSEDDYETVALGALQSVTGTAPEFTFTFDSILTHWATKHETDAANMGLFDKLDLNDADRTRITTTTSLAWAPGSSSELEVSATANFDRGSSGIGMLLCSDPTYGDPFYMTYTGEGTGPVKFTGVSSSDLRLTTPVPLGSGATVSACAYMDGHPCDIAQEVLLSTGDGVHGAHDDLPRTWGFAAFEEWVDSADIDEIKGIVGNKSGTDHDWQVVVEQGQDSAISWLQTLLSEAGIWLTMRQGMVTVRAAQNTDMDSSDRHEDLLLVDDFELTNEDIIEVMDYQFWFSEVSTESMVCSAYYNPTHTYSAGYTPSAVSITDTIATTLPAVARSEHDLTDVIWVNSVDPATDVVNRCHIWELRVPEYAKVMCAGLRCAQLCPGDVIPVTSQQLRGRLDRTADGWDAVDAMVIGVSVSWMDNTVELELCVASHEFST